jgi:hypothetical protein
MSFSIKLQNPTDNTNEHKECFGVITIDDFQETLVVPLEYWSKNDYQQHWKKSLERALRKEDSCLITSMYDPQKANFIVWWLLYIRENKVIVQNHLLFLNTLSESFTPDNPYRFIPKYESENEDGDKISEWIVPIEDIEAFLAEDEKSK